MTVFMTWSPRWAFTELFTHLFDKDAAPSAASGLCQALPLKPRPSPDPGIPSPHSFHRGEEYQGIMGHKVLEACAFVGASRERTPPADMLTVSWEQEKKLRQESAPFKLFSAVLGILFFLNKDLYIFIQAQMLIGRCLEKKSWNCRGKLYVNAIK